MHLAGRHNYVEHAEVLLEAMAHKNAAAVHQEAQLEVGLPQGDEREWGNARVQVARLQAAVLGKVVIHRLARGDVVIDAGLMLAVS